MQLDKLHATNTATAMAEKRKRDPATAPSSDSKRPKKGFQVGPANLPDGVHKRKVKKIKESLIERALIQKEYARLKRQGKLPEIQDESIPTPASAHLDQDQDQNNSSDEPAAPAQAEPPSAPHPDRQAQMNAPSPSPEPVEKPTPRERQPRQRKPKHQPFAKEHAQAQARKEEAERRRQVREQAERERAMKREERERFRKAMAKARTTGPNGQRKLGRESNVLLDKVKRMVAEGK